MSTDSYDEIIDVCSMCNHNRIYHTYIREMNVLVCKIKACKCMRNVPNMMTYTEKLMEEMR